MTNPFTNLKQSIAQENLEKEVENNKQAHLQKLCRDFLPQAQEKVGCIWNDFGQVIHELCDIPEFKKVLSKMDGIKSTKLQFGNQPKVEVSSNWMYIPPNALYFKMGDYHHYDPPRGHGERGSSFDGTYIEIYYDVKFDIKNQSLTLSNRKNSEPIVSNQKDDLRLDIMQSLIKQLRHWEAPNELILGLEDAWKAYLPTELSFTEPAPQPI